MRSPQALLALDGLICGQHCTGQEEEYPAEANSSRSRTLCATDHHLQKVRSADTRRNRSAIYRAVRRPANPRAAHRAGGLRLGAKLRAGQAGQAQVRGVKITDSVIAGRPGTAAEYLAGYIRDAPP